VPPHMPVAVASFATLTFVAVALVCRLPSLRTQTIMTLDFLLFAVNIAVGSLSSIAITENGDHFPSYEGILLGLVLHGVFVPTRTRFAVALGGVAVVTFLGAQLGGSFFYPPLRALWDATPGTHVFPVLLGYKTMAVLFFAAIGVLASRIFYGLARDAYKAKRLGNYTLERELASGGMGQVFVARHRMLRRPTAVKVIRPERLGSGAVEELARFEREVDLASRLTHPNTISIYDFGRAADGTFYFAMELLSGWNLHELVLRHGPLPAPRAVHVLKQICGSLSEAHELGIVHRDIKPSNVILTRRGGLCDFVKVIDF